MGSAHDSIQLSWDGRVAILTIDRPQRRNALHGPLWSALRDSLRGLAEESPRVVILQGAAGHFCAGMDLRPDNPLLGRVAEAVRRGDEAAVRAIIVDLKQTMAAVRRIQAPVIAAIEGACVGGGLELALACDLRVAAEDAILSLPEVRYGMVADVGGVSRLTRLVGRARATDLALTGRRLDAQTALAWGLVDRAVPPGQAFPTARALATEIQRGSPAAVRGTLLVIRTAAELDETDLLLRETEAGATAVCSGEVMEGVASFASGQAPSWAER